MLDAAKPSPLRADLPRSPDRLVDRARLFERLDHGVGGPLTTVTGRAGAGKTLLVVSWLRADRAPWPVAWLAVEPGTSAARFWAGVLSALQAAAPGAPELAQLAPPLEKASGADFPSLLVAALSELDAPVVLVLDDVHELRDDEALRQLGQVVDQASVRLRTIVASRRDPDLALHRLRLTGAVTEIRTDELAFSVAETEELFAQLGHDLDERQARALCDRTEGWAAGLRIAALSLDRAPDVGELVRSVSGDDRPLAEYLVAEVLVRQPPEARDFLLRTSVATRLTPALADVLTGGDDGARRLAELEQDNAFVVAVDAGGTWYRYHQLFADVLRLELGRRLPGEVTGLHLRAARWHADRGLWREAMDHAAAADDPKLVGRLLSDGWLDLYLQGDTESARAVIRRLPTDLVAAEPLLAVSVAAMHLNDADATAAGPCLRLAEAGAHLVRGEDRRHYEVSLAVAQLLHDRLVGDLQGTIARARRVLEPGGDVPWQRELATEDKRALAALNVGATELLTGGRSASSLNLLRALDIARRRGRDHLVVSALGYLAWLDAISGDLRRADERAREAIDLAERRGWLGSPTVAPALLAHASCRYCWDGLDDAMDSVDRAREALGQTAEPAIWLTLRYVEGQILAAAGRHDEALECLGEAAEMRRHYRDPHFLGEATTWAQANVLIDAGREDEAAALLAAGGADRRSLERLVPLARLRHLAGAHEEALALLEPCLGDDDDDGAAGHGHVEQMLDALLIAAQAHDARGETAEAGRLLERALELAEPQGMVRPLINHGEPLAPLLERQVRAGTAHRSLVADVLDRLEEPGRAPAPASPDVDPLSDRELDVLRYLPTLMTAAEIAAELFVSVNTVRTHVKNIYRKLGVRRRSEAVERAKAAGLLAPSSRVARRP